MKQILKPFIFFLLIVIPCLWVTPVLAHNPFTSKPEKQHQAPAPPFKSQFFVKLILWQNTLKQKMSNLVREVRRTGDVWPLVILMGMAFSYGAVHSAGPGHGKFVAVSYILSHDASLTRGVLFGMGVGMFHGLSGAVGVLGLNTLVRKGVGDTLGTVTEITQVIGFGLITLLGLGLLLKHGADLFFKPRTEPGKKDQNMDRKGLLSWVVSLGLVPCPAVVMVMLFCITMDALLLGMLLAVCVSLGMAATISAVAMATAMGKSGMLQMIPPKHEKLFEGAVGMVSGIAVTVFGGIFFMASLT